MDEISKKELLAETGISYGQLYRWKREGLIPDEWFVKRAAYTGQETWFPRERILERIGMILERKDDQSLEEIRRQIEGTGDKELEGLTREAALAAERIGISASVVLFETNDGRHFALFDKGGSVFFDSGVRMLKTLTEKQLREQIKTGAKETGDKVAGESTANESITGESATNEGITGESTAGQTGSLQDNEAVMQSEKKGVE